MAHFARIDADGTVLCVMAISNEEIVGADGQDDPEAGVARCREILGEPDSTWVQTSARTISGHHPDGKPMRYNFAGIGDVYNEEHDTFMRPQPYPSWTLGEVPDPSEEDFTAADVVQKRVDPDLGSDVVHDVAPRTTGKTIPVWVPPVPMPPPLEVEGEPAWIYDWDEDNQEWVVIDPERPAP